MENDLTKGIYPTGFRVGDRVRIVKGPRKYNKGIPLQVGDTGTVREPPNIEGWPQDAVQVHVDGEGEGALDSCILEKVSQ